MSISIGIPDIRERDIDLLILEELVASPDFLEWFLSRLGFPNDLALEEANRSVNTDSGESDLELTVMNSERRIKILVENKIDAAFQPDQPERYRQRAEAYRRTAHFTEVSAVVTAPAVYFGEDGEQYGFDCALTYEEIINWFETTKPMLLRSAFKLSMLRAAIERGRQGWILVPSEPVGRFWRRYWQLAQEVAPSLAMPFPKSEIPANSHFIVFQPVGLPADVKLKHKVAYGHVDLELRGRAAQIAEVQRMFGDKLPVSATIERAGKSVAIRVRVSPIDMVREPFELRRDAIQEALDAALQLLTWFRTVS